MQSRVAPPYLLLLAAGAARTAELNDVQGHGRSPPAARNPQAHPVLLPPLLLLLALALGLRLCAAAACRERGRCSSRLRRIGAAAAAAAALARTAAAAATIPAAAAWPRGSG